MFRHSRGQRNNLFRSYQPRSLRDIYSADPQLYANSILLYQTYTRKNLTFVPSLLTSRQQVVFALLVPSCLEVLYKLLTTCNSLVHIIRLVARLFQQVRYSHDITILLQPCVINLVTFLLYHDCIRLVGTTL
jgi:hypothetical protein